VFLRGRVGQVELADEMQQARVLAYPTAFLETSCITAMEARAAGLAIVTSSLGALRETVGKHGILVPWPAGEDEAGNRNGQYQEDFVGAVVKLLTDERRWTAIHRVARKGVGGLEWSERVTDWETLLPSVAAEALAAAAAA
jgi:glycosyltransferase involved in cell wall biosynthesis